MADECLWTDGKERKGGITPRASRHLCCACYGPWAICGDFNMIYRAADKNNGRLHHSLMRRFQSFLDDLELDEVHLLGRLFTWSNSHDNPTLEHLDWVCVHVRRVGAAVP